MSQPGTQGPPPEKLSWKGYLGTGLFLYVAGAVMFFYFAHLEETGERTTMNAAVALLYRLGGKWLVSGFCAVVGTGFLVAAVKTRNAPRG